MTVTRTRPVRVLPRRDGLPGAAVIQQGKRAVLLDAAEALAVADLLVDTVELQRHGPSNPTRSPRNDGGDRLAFTTRSRPPILRYQADPDIAKTPS